MRQHWPSADSLAAVFNQVKANTVVLIITQPVHLLMHELNIHVHDIVVFNVTCLYLYVVHYTCIILCVSGWIQIDIVESSRVSVKERGVELIDLLRERLEQRHTLTELQGKEREKRERFHVSRSILKHTLYNVHIHRNDHQ